jgi:diguanylate cyclase (GGDEF)-like protein
MLPTRDVNELIALAYRDDLTGLYNRRYFRESLIKPLEDTLDQTLYSFLLVDIDFFKDINDSYGHQTGDHVLVTVAKLLTEALDGEETAVRYAGDEFIVFLPGADQHAAFQKASSIVDRMQRKALPMNDSNEYVQLTLSIGVASYPTDGDNWEAIIEKADQGLYAAKQQGRNRACLPPEDGVGITRGDDLSSLFPCPKFIGRGEALEQVLSSLARCQASRSPASPSLFLCTGDRGSGKTRFLQEVGKAIDESDRCVIHLSGSEQLRELPYGALIKGFLERFGTVDNLRGIMGTPLQPAHESLWETLFAGVQADPETLSADAAGRFLVETLEALEQKVRVVFLIDEADLLDPPTMALVKAFHLSENSGPNPFVLMAASEDQVSFEPSKSTPEGSDGRPPSAVFHEMTLPVVELTPFHGGDVEEMVQTVFPTLRVEPLFHTELLLQTQGNPSYLEEVLKYLVQTGRLVYHRSAWRWEGDGLHDLPDTLESLLENRLSTLDPEVQTLLEKASMMGPEIDPDLIQKLEQSNEGHLWDLLDKARNFGVLRSSSRWEYSDLRFSSKTAQQVSYDQVPEEDRITWHLQMARLFESLRQKPNLLQLGPLLYHAEMAGLQTELRTIREKFSLLTAPQQATVLSVPSRKKKRTAPVKHSPIPQEGWPRIQSLFHLLRAAIQSLRLYPETSQTVSSACQRLLDGLDGAFELTESIHLSEAEGVVLVNGEPPPWKGEERIATEGFYRFLADASLKDLSFHKGLTLHEVRAFLSTWNSVLTHSLDPNAEWDAFEDREDVEHIRINAKIYVAVSDSNLCVDGPIVTPMETPDGPGEALSHVLGSSDNPVADLSQLLGSLESKILSMQEMVGTETIDPEEISSVVSLLEQARELLPTLKQGIASAARHVEAPVNPPAPENEEAPSPPPASRPEALGEMELDPLDEDDVRCCLSDILSGESLREAQGYKRISEMGAKAVEPLYYFMTQTDDAHAGRICARFLQSLETDLHRRVQSDMESRKDSSVKLRLLQYATPALEPGPRQGVLVAALQQEHDAPMREALHQLETDFPADAGRILLEALAGSPDRFRYDICLSLGKLGDARCLPQLLGHLDKISARREVGEDRFSEGLCLALGNFNEPRVVQKLGALLASNGKFPWRRKRVHPGVRKAALLALIKIGGNSVYAVLKKHEHDRDPWIRFRARSFLKGESVPQRPPRQAA